MLTLGTTLNLSNLRSIPQIFNYGTYLHRSLSVGDHLKNVSALLQQLSNKDLWRATGQEDINLEIRKRKFSWIGHILRKEDGEVPKAALLWNP